MEERKIYKIKFYVSALGDCPFEEFLENAGTKVEVKFAKLLKILSYEGPNLKRPYADMLKSGIRELRVIFSSNQYRGLYFFFHGDYIIVTHGFVNKTDSVPEHEIDLAIRYKTDFESRVNTGELNL